MWEQRGEAGISKWVTASNPLMASCGRSMVRDGEKISA